MREESPLSRPTRPSCDSTRAPACTTGASRGCRAGRTRPPGNFSLFPALAPCALPAFTLYMYRHRNPLRNSTPGARPLPPPAAPIGCGECGRPCLRPVHGMAPAPCCPPCGDVASSPFGFCYEKVSARTATRSRPRRELARGPREDDGMQAFVRHEYAIGGPAGPVGCFQKGHHPPHRVAQPKALLRANPPKGGDAESWGYSGRSARQARQAASEPPEIGSASPAALQFGADAHKQPGAPGSDGGPT